MNSLYSLAHELLTLGMDGSPVYSDSFARLNREVYEQALKLYNAPIGETPEQEAGICLSLLIAFNATYCDNGHKQQYVQSTLDRSFAVLPALETSLLKVRLLVYCYSESYESSLAEEAHVIIDTWDKSALLPEQIEIIGELKNVEDNPYPWEAVDTESL